MHKVRSIENDADKVASFIHSFRKAMQACWQPESMRTDFSKYFKRTCMKGNVLSYESHEQGKFEN